MASAGTGVFLLRVALARAGFAAGATYLDMAMSLSHPHPRDPVISKERIHKIGPDKARATGHKNA